MEKKVFCFPSEIAKFRLVLLHGWGADADDLMPIGKELIKGIGESVELVSLNAPYVHPQGFGRQWYSLFPADWIEAEKSVIDLRLRLENVSTLEVPLEKTVLFGFSQGGAMAIASGCGLPLAGLIVCSGYPHKNLIFSGKLPPVFLSHGNEDPVVPKEATKELVKLIEQRNKSPQTELFEGGHEIPESIYKEITNFLKKCFIESD